MKEKLKNKITATNQLREKNLASRISSNPHSSKRSYKYLGLSSGNILHTKTEESAEMTINQQIQDYSEKEAFDNMIKYAKKGDRVEFIKSIEK